VLFVVDEWVDVYVVFGVLVDGECVYVFGEVV